MERDLYRLLTVCTTVTAGVLAAGCTVEPSAAAGEAPSSLAEVAELEAEPEDVAGIAAPTIQATIDVAAAPRVVIGRGAAGPTLFRVSDAVRLADGRVVVGDASRNLYVFDEEGRPIGSWGGPGQGPGEFGVVSDIHRLPGDTIAVYDLREYRLTYFAPNGELVRTFRPPGTPWRIRAVFNDGTFLVSEAVSSEVTGTALVRSQHALQRRNSSGEVLREFGVFPAGESMRPQSTTPMPVVIFPLFRVTRLAVGPQEVYVAPGYRFEVLVVPVDGPPRVLISRQTALRPLTAAELVQSVPNLRLREADVPLPVDQTYPATRELLVDALGNVWIEEFPLDSEQPGLWMVVDPRGVVLDNVEMPRGFFPLDVGADWILGLSKDEWDVESIELRDLVRS